MKIGTALILAGAVLVLLGAFLFWYDSASAPVAEERSRLGDSDTPFVPLDSFSIEVVDTDEARAQGLSGRTEVPERYGMLFVFPEAGRYGFWMKDMFVAIDIIWLAEDGTILAIDEAISPETYPRSFYPPQSVRFVLETKAGEARRSGWEAGTKLDISNY